MTENILNFNVEKYEDITEDLDRLFSIAVSEIVNDCPFKAEVDHEQFIQMDDIGLLQMVTARKNGELVGFHASTITNDIFYKGKKTAYVLMYFLTKEHRGNGAGFYMFKCADDLFKEKKIDRSFMSRKIHIDNEKMFTKLGYTKIESNYEKYYDR